MTTSLNYISSKHTDMGNGREGLAGIVREVMGHPDKDSDIKNMCKTYTLEDNDGLMAELKSMHGKMAEMRGRLERDEITPDEWREWYAGYQARLDEIKEAVSGMREEVSRRNADLERQKRERAAELNMSLEEYEDYLKSLIVCSGI